MKNYRLIIALAILVTGLVAFSAVAADAPESNEVVELPANPDLEPTSGNCPPGSSAAEATLDLFPEPELMMGQGCPKKDRFQTFDPFSQSQQACDDFCVTSCAEGGGTVQFASWAGPRGLWCTCYCCAN